MTVLVRFRYGAQSVSLALAIAWTASAESLPTKVREVQEKYPAATVVRVTPEEGFAAGRDKVRAIRAKNGGRLPPGGVFVEFDDGVYPVLEPVEFGPGDSGDPEAPVLYVAKHCGKAVVDGSISPKWRPASAADERFAIIPEKARPHVVVADIPGKDPLPGFCQADRYMHRQLLTARGEAPLQVYADGLRLPCARWPNGEESARIAGAGKPKKESYPPLWRDAPFTMTRECGEKADYAALAAEPDLWIHGEWHYHYASSCAPVASVDAQAECFRVAAEYIPEGLEYGMPAFALNAFSQLDEPGEWAVDRSNRKVYLWPKAGDARVALAKGLVRVRDATDIAFEGFAFRNCRDAAIRLERCRDVTVRASEVRCTSRWAVEVDGGRGCLVQGCDMFELGEGGVALHGGSRDTLAEARHAVDNCHIGRYGQLHWNYNPGVMLEGTGCRATHNLVHHSRHQAFTYNGSLHYVGWNIAHDLCRKNKDAGAIYCYHTDDTYTRRGNVIEYNTFFHTGDEPSPEQCEGIYVDAFTSGVRVRGNIVVYCANGAFSSGGQDNVVERNLFVKTANMFRRWNLGRMGGGDNMHPVVRAGRESPYIKPLLQRLDFFGRDFFTRRFPNMLRIAEFEDPYFAHDALFCRFESNVGASSGPYIIIDEEFTREYTTCTNNVSLPGDPGFVDYEGMDWELAEDSPARKVLGGGTRFAEMGLYDSPVRFSKAVKWGEGASRPPRLDGAPYALAPNSRVDLLLVGDLPQGETTFADAIEGCWPHPFEKSGKALVCGFNSITGEEWRECKFSFTPRFDCKAELWLVGYAGAPTYFDDVRVEGAEGPVNGDFSGNGGWEGPLQAAIAPAPSTPRGDGFGIVGGRAKVSDRYALKQTLSFAKGRRVTISYRAGPR